MISINKDFKLHNVYPLSLIMPLRTSKLLVIIYKYLKKTWRETKNLPLTWNCFHSIEFPNCSVIPKKLLGKQFLLANIMSHCHQGHSVFSIPVHLRWWFLTNQICTSWPLKLKKKQKKNNNIKTNVIFTTILYIDMLPVLDCSGCSQNNNKKMKNNH